MQHAMYAVEALSGFVGGAVKGFFKGPPAKKPSNMGWKEYRAWQETAAAEAAKTTPESP